MAVALNLECRVEPTDVTIIRTVEAVATAMGRPPRALHLQSLLQLPRVADQRGIVRVQLVRSLVSDLAGEMPPLEEWMVPTFALSSAHIDVRPIAPLSARDVMARFHYLRSPRLDAARAYGLCTEGDRLAALSVSSPLDVLSLRELLGSQARPVTTARVLSRVFAFDGVPKNSISYLLARVARAERGHGTTDLVTYLNPNLGFSGSSYLASGWHVLGEEPGTKYRYLDGRYITDRKLAALLGTHDDATYASMLADRFAVSRMPLRPLRIYHAVID